MKRKLPNELVNTSVEYQDDEVKTASPKDLRATDSGLTPKEVLQRLHGAVGVLPVGAHPEAPEKPEEQASEETLKRLDGTRVWFEAEVGDFTWEEGYNGYRERRVLLKNVKFRDSGRLLKERLWLTSRKWAEELRVGDVIAFDARLENGGLKNPNNVAFIEFALRQGGGTHGADQILMF